MIAMLIAVAPLRMVSACRRMASRRRPATGRRLGLCQLGDGTGRPLDHVLDPDKLLREIEVAVRDPAPDVFGGDRQLGGSEGAGLSNQVVRVELGHKGAEQVPDPQSAARGGLVAGLDRVVRGATSSRGFRSLFEGSSGSP